MEEPPGFERTPTLDDSFVAGAAHREPSHSERNHVRDEAADRARRYRAELEAGYQARLQHERDRQATAGEHRPPGDRRRRVRQVIGVVITVTAIVVAYGSQYFPVGRSAHIGLVPPPVSGCDPSIYPAGAAYRFEQCWDGQPVAWQRCTALSVVADPTSAPASWSADLADAIAQLTAATGLKFRMSTHGDGDITVNWSSNLLAPAGAERDKAGITRLQSHVSTVRAEISNAGILISTRLGGGTGLNGEVPVLLHEFGHAVGLGHFSGPVVMNPVDQGYPSYRGGDLSGLAALYQPSSCR